jgi:hypothetical protein
LCLALLCSIRDEEDKISYFLHRKQAKSWDVKKPSKVPEKLLFQCFVNTTSKKQNKKKP